jgi:hypothetical protein
MIIVTVAATASAMGPEYMIPSIPKNKGSIRISGSRNRICLVRDRNIPLWGRPVAVKKFETTGCTKLMKIKKK